MRDEKQSTPATFWQRTTSWLRRLFGREVAPGRFESHAKFSWHGWLAGNPLVWPRREYLVYVPRGFSRLKHPPLLVLCHACKQKPEEIVEATRMTAFADREGWVILLPRQKESANAWQCWNWFDARTVEGKGEAAIVSAQIEDVVQRYGIEPRRVLVSGMSAGGALAAVVGIRHAGSVRGVIVHSGLACGAASSPMTALGVMKRGPDADVERIAFDARRDAADGALPIPLLVIHGDLDDVVAPRNAIALVRQYLRMNGHPAIDSPIASQSSLPAADAQSRALIDGRTMTTHDWRIDSRVVVRLITIDGLGHAWSGGDEKFPYIDGHAPDASALIAEFARDALP
jgi:poly(hydroxyalkanoate) depolymerase family esterase